MSCKDHQIQHKLGDAVLTEESIDQLRAWQEGDNESLKDCICSVLKSIRFLAVMASWYQFDDEHKAESNEHITNLAELSKVLEVFRK